MPFTDDPTAGEFSATPKIEFIDTPGAPNRTVRVIEDFTFTEAATGTVWQAPSGSLVDGASIPRVLWTLVGSPFTGDYFYASIVHDVACQLRSRPWPEVHYMFYLACLAGGTKRGRAKYMYLAVRNFGPHWPAPSPLAPKTAVFESQANLLLLEEAPVPTARRARQELEQERYLLRAQHYLATHGEDAPLEAIDEYAARPE